MQICMNRTRVVTARAAPPSRQRPVANLRHATTLTRARPTIVCFRGETEGATTPATQSRKTAAMSMPTVANSIEVSQAAGLASVDFKYHSSFWHRDLLDSKEQLLLGPGVGDYSEALQRWREAYPSVMQHQQLVVASGNDAFLFPQFSAVNDGEFLGQAASHRRSRCVAAYRVHFNELDQVAGLWEFRSGTREEAHALLREPGRMSGQEWLVDFAPYPCTWQPDEALHAKMLAQVHRWLHDVWMQGDVKAITDICAPDVVVYDGVGVTIPHRGPVVGTAAVQAVLGGIFKRYNPGGMVPLATAVGPVPNQVAVHWTQCLFEKQAGAASRQSGISLFVFDHAGLVVQQLHFSEPLEAARPGLFHETRIVATPPPQPATIVASPPQERRIMRAEPQA